MVTARLHTAEDLWKLASHDDRFELIEGELVEVFPRRRPEGIAQARMGSRLLTFVESHRLGIVSMEEGFLLRRNPDTVLAPDVAFISTERLGEAEQFWSDIPPDLAVEIISPSNTHREIERKVRIYLESGVRLVWLVDPQRREVILHEPGQSPCSISGDALLTGGDILPGFQLPLPELFGQ